MSLQQGLKAYTVKADTKVSAVAPEDQISIGDARIFRGTPAYWRISAALLMAGFSTFALLYTTQPLLPVFATDFNISAAEASLAVSFSTGAMALSFIPAGLLSDRIGRRPMMIVSMFGPAFFTLISAFLPGWHTLLVMRALTGLALAGVPSVAMAYVSEEVDAGSVGSAMGLYIGGSAIGGMMGRLVVTVLSDLLGWRLALAGMGAISLIAALLFWVLAPASRAFVPSGQNARGMLSATGRLLRDAAFPLLYLEGFLMMGAFVTVYNYVGFRLRLEPYLLSQSAIGSIFLVYIIGSISSAWFGGIAGRLGHRKVLWMPILGIGVGILLTTLRPLPVIILGIALMTGAFFAAHSTASGWIGRRATADRAQAASLYLLCYYMGSSILGSVGGLAWRAANWPGVATFSIVLVCLALALSVRLTSVKVPAETKTKTD